MKTTNHRGMNERLAFIDILRGVSSFAVAIGHLLFQFFLAPMEYSQVIMALPTQAVVFPNWLNTVALIGPALSATSVAVFFLISGFVIPFTLEKSSINNLSLIHI